MCPPCFRRDGCSGCGSADHRVADRVRLRIFQGDERDDQVADSAVGQFLVRGHDVAQQFPIDLKIIAPLLEGDAVDLLVLDGIGNIARIDLHDIIIAFPLGSQNL